MNDLAHRVAGLPYIDLHGLDMLPWLDLYCICPAQHLRTAGQDVDDLDLDLR